MKSRRAFLLTLCAPILSRVIPPPVLHLEIERVQIVARPRKLTGTWTFERIEDLRKAHDLLT